MSTSRLPVASFLAAESLALLGNSAFLVAFPWLVLSYTGSASASSALTALVMIPTAVATLAAGRQIDGVGRKAASVIAGLGCAVAAAVLCVADGAGGLSAPMLIVLGMAAQLFVSPSTTARDALMDDIAAAGGVAVERLAGMRQVVFSIAYAVGPALAGLLLGAGPSFVVVGVVAAAALLTTTLPGGARQRPASADGGHRPASLGGLLRSRRSVRAALVIGFGTAVISAPMTSVLLPAHFKALGQPQLYGIVISAFAIGALAGSLAYAVLAKRAGVGCYVAAVIVTTVAITGFAFLPPFWVLAAALFVGGMGSGMLAPMLLVAVTKSTRQNERGRALGVYNAASLGAGPVGLSLLGLVLQASPGLLAGTFAVLALWVVVAVYALARVRAIAIPELPRVAEPAEALTR